MVVIPCWLCDMGVHFPGNMVMKILWEWILPVLICKSDSGMLTHFCIPWHEYAWCASRQASQSFQCHCFWSRKCNLQVTSCHLKRKKSTLLQVVMSLFFFFWLWMLSILQRTHSFCMQFPGNTPGWSFPHEFFQGPESFSGAKFLAHLILEHFVHEAFAGMMDKTSDR